MKVENGTVFVAFRIDEWQAAALKAIADEDQRSRNSLMRSVITTYIKSRMDELQINAFKKEAGFVDNDQSKHITSL